MRNFLIDLLLGTRYFFVEGYIEVLNGLAPFIGYVLIFSTIVNCLLSIFPMQSGDPAWELATISTILEQIWGLIVGLGLGFVFISFYDGDDRGVEPNQVAFLRVTRWLSFLLALGFIFAVPLIVVDSHKLIADSNSKLQEIQASRIDKIHQLEQKVDKVTNPAQMKALAQQIQLDNNSFAGMSFTDIKDKLKNGLDKFAKQNEQALMIQQEKKAAVIRKKAIYNIVNCLILFAAFLRIGSKIGSVGIEKNYYDT